MFNQVERAYHPPLASLSYENVPINLLHRSENAVSSRVPILSKMFPYWCIAEFVTSLCDSSMVLGESFHSSLSTLPTILSLIGSSSLTFTTRQNVQKVL